MTGELKNLGEMKRVFIMKSLSFTQSKKCDEGVFLYLIYSTPCSLSILSKNIKKPLAF